jgi:hypothetical protein
MPELPPPPPGEEPAEQEQAKLKTSETSNDHLCMENCFF